MIVCLYYLSRKIPDRCESSFVELQNKLQKALLVSEANHTGFEPSQYEYKVIHANIPFTVTYCHNSNYEHEYNGLVQILRNE